MKSYITLALLLLVGVSAFSFGSPKNAQQKGGAFASSSNIHLTALPENIAIVPSAIFLGGVCLATFVATKDDALEGAEFSSDVSDEIFQMAGDAIDQMLQTQKLTVEDNPKDEPKDKPSNSMADPVNKISVENDYQSWERVSEPTMKKPLAEGLSEQRKAISSTPTTKGTQSLQASAGKAKKSTLVLELQAEQEQEKEDDDNTPKKGRKRRIIKQFVRKIAGVVRRRFFQKVVGKC